MGSVSAFNRLKAGIRSSVSGTSSTFGGRGGRENSLIPGFSCPAVSSGTLNPPGRALEPNRELFTCGDKAVVTDVGVVVVLSAFLTTAGFFSHVVMEDWSMIDYAFRCLSVCCLLCSLWVGGGCKILSCGRSKPGLEVFGYLHPSLYRHIHTHT